MPQVGTHLSPRDCLGILRARIGIARNQYKLNPGLYCVGNPTAESSIFVTANYKLSFDFLRKELSGINAWILVVDTRGINVWCAAGKGSFSAAEVALQVQRARLSEIVSHRELILPQFAAPGVAAHELKKRCGFTGKFGPLRAADIPKFIANGKKADDRMRAVTFTLAERLILVPVEIALTWKLFAICIVAIFALSGIGPNLYSVSVSLSRGMTAANATVFAILAGAFATPCLLPWIPGRQFWWKGVIVGGVAGMGFIMFFMRQSTLTETISIWLWIVAASSYMAMNFTGATPYTSLSGVEKEMRLGLPVQVGALFVATAGWLASPFIS